MREGCRILSAANRIGACNFEHIQTCQVDRLILSASPSKFRSATLRLCGDQTAEKATGSGSSMIGRKTTPDVGTSDEAAPMTVMPKSCPTIDSNVSRPTSNLRIEGAGQIPARRKTIWSCTCGPVPPCLTMNVSAARSAHVAAERPTRACRVDSAAKRGSVHIRREWQSGGSGMPATNAMSSRSARSCVRESRAVHSTISISM